ncbi:hypothetical protein SODALDRAFT_394444 [Sodiomyces alkalinus F11]|uniref:F-box domain-containing protein n=1 Tax=Sodiomyces alkalinus (strain CBS 110278 / VKM F-3762 / F11) TaxID=1314773 RepID=A0A3N2PLQ3_SODAK|nr:hypothetical protein SODALDRAFT_394444 [Sodiomyces alkalinus F11]ROT35448.1 hypothetical protein SODALDRAFT_394444 [Sodiomyces alkalinus F11]
MDAFVALLLSKLHELRVFHLGPNFCKDLALTGMMLRFALCAGPAGSLNLSRFYRLEELSCQNDTYPGIKNPVRTTYTILPFFYLLGIRKVKADIENPITIFTWPSHLPDPSNLTILDLRDVRELFLTNLLAVTKGLRSLRWDWYSMKSVARSGDPVYESPIIDLDQFATAVLQVRHTLNELIISGTTDAPGDRDQPEVYIHGSLQALVGLDELRTLEAPMPFLTGTFSIADGTTHNLDRVLARNIERLRLRCDFYSERNEWEEEVVLRFVESWLDSGNWKQVTRHLRSLSLPTKERPERGRS